MLPMTLFETGDSCGEVSLASLFEGKPLSPTRHETGLKEVANWCCRGGNSFAFWERGDLVLRRYPRHRTLPVDPALLQASKHIPKKEVPRLDDSDSFGILFVPALANDDALLV